MKPRSFTPDSLSVHNIGVSSTPSPVDIHDNNVPKRQLGVGNSIVVNDHNKEEILFQPKPYKADNYKVTDFIHKTTPQGRTYR